MLKLVTCCFCLAIGVILEVAPSGNYTRGLVKYLENESKLYQVMFIIDLNSSSSSFVKEVSEHFPSLSMTINNVQSDLEKHFAPLAQRPRRTTLFILILDGNQSHIWLTHLRYVIMQLQQLSQGHSYPKCLISLFSETEFSSMNEILEFLFLKDFVDLVVLEHIQKNQKSLSWTADILPNLHEMNLFAKTYSVQKVKSETKWFPNKFLNLHGRPIRFLLASLGDTFRTSYFIEAFKFLDLFKSMHCKIELVFDYESRNGTSLFNRFKRERAELILNLLNQNVVGDMPNPKLRILGFNAAKAVIPNSKRFTKTLVISQEFIDMLIATTVAITVIRITAFMLKFRRSTWETFNISQLVMGVSVIREPIKLPERIVFGALIMSCIVYSGYLYSVILGINFLSEPEISTLKELANSSLTPMLRSTTKSFLLDSFIPHIQELGKKSVTLPDRSTVFDCMAYLARYKNVSCIMLEAQNLVKMFTIQHNEINIKILQESLVDFIQIFEVRSGSPFIDRFNEIILKAFDSGLLTKLLHNHVTKPIEFSLTEEIGKEKLLLIICYVMAIGYTLATIAFIAEVSSKIRTTSL